MLYQIIVAIGLIAFTANLVLNLRSLRRPSPDATLCRPAPFISVLIPARDEEANIGNCLDSLRKQDYPNFEILVLDDNSTDNTSIVIDRIAATDSRIQRFTGKPLPKGWAGKPFACYQLAKKARGSWFLFVDADTIHDPNMLRSMISLADEVRPSLLSGFPRQLATSLVQKIAIPVLYFVILSCFPLWWLQRCNKPSLAIGQFLLFPRDEYWRFGGHAAVKSRILEDVWLGIEVNRIGGRHLAVDLSPMVSCHMYNSLGGMWIGFSKWIYSVASLSWMALVGLLVAGYIFFLAPFYWLSNELLMIQDQSGRINILIFQVAMVLGMRWIADSHFKESLVSTLLHPIGFLFLILVVLNSLTQRITGSGVRWKERLYKKESGVR
jgi:chlorobactene glucosyltransferase